MIKLERAQNQMKTWTFEQNKIWFVFIGSPTETGTNPSWVYISGVAPWIWIFFRKIVRSPQANTPNRILPGVFAWGERTIFRVNYINSVLITLIK
jgi:hypothetical protein